MFLQCKKCDFEWHESDGELCPVCDCESQESVPDDESEAGRLAELSEGGAFGSGPFAKSQASCFTALAILALVYFILRFVIGG
tara:strand:+ start:947 stop:1195 length:249 start_codon:yes stop_codon:yes gene_type:complete